ncbi:MAG: hypothetical protein ACP5FK_06855 [bacterium]
MVSKKLLLSVISFSILFVTLAYGLDVNLSMEIWDRWTIVNQDSITENYMSVERAYFRIEPKFGDYIKGRFNIDVFSSDKGNDANGAGLKLKYAYLDFVNLIDYHTITVGLMKNYFGTIYDWEYPTIEKDINDLEHVLSSTDYGLGVTGKFDYFTYNVAVYNGEGYKKTGDDVNTNPCFMGNVRISPIEYFTIGGSIRYHKYGTVDSINDEYNTQMAYAGVANINFDPINIWFEYIVDQDDDPNLDTTITAQGFTVMPVLSLKNMTGADVELVARYDQWDPNTDVDDDGHNRIIAGINWNAYKDGSNKVMIQANYERLSWEADGVDPVDVFALQFRWKFKTAI